MSIPIDLFESHIPEESLFEGEKLYDLKAVKAFHKENNKLFSFRIYDGKDYEVELKTTGANLQMASCECAQKSSQRLCSHIICALFYFRAEIWPQEFKDSKTTKSIKPQSIKTDHIINQLTAEELKNFVRSHAKKDKNFALAFKVRFLSKMDKNENAAIYKTILDQILKPRTTKQFKYSLSEISTFKKTVYEFYDQLQDNLSLEKYDQAFYIQTICLEKIYYLKHWLGKDDKSVEELRLVGIENIEYLMNTEVSPEFRIKIRVFLFDLLQKSYFQIYSPQSKYLALLFELSLEQETENIFFHTLKSKFSFDGNSNLSKLNYAIYLILLHRNIEGANFDWLLNESSEFNLKIIQMLLDFKEESYVQLLLKLVEKHKNLNKAILADYYLQLYALQKKDDLFLDLAVSQFEITGKSIYYRKAKNVAGKNWKKTRIGLEKSLLKKLSQDGSAQIYQFYSLEKDPAKIKNLILTHNDFESFTDYLSELLSLPEADFFEFSTQMIDFEISHRVGIHLNSKIIKFLHQLKRNTAYKIERKLISYIKKKYAYRSSLIKELSFY